MMEGSQQAVKAHAQLAAAGKQSAGPDLVLHCTSKSQRQRIGEPGTAQDTHQFWVVSEVNSQDMCKNRCAIK